MKCLSATALAYLLYYNPFKKRLGKKKWRHQVTGVITRLKTALEADEVVVGGGNAKLLDALPRGVRRGSNANAFVGGYRLWKPGV